jgi:hypothetical protein
MIPTLYPLTSSSYLSPFPVIPSSLGYLTSAIGSSLYLVNNVGYPGEEDTVGYIYWNNINSSGEITGQQNWPGSNLVVDGNGVYGAFQMSGLCSLYFPEAGNYFLALTQSDGVIFAIQGATIVSGPANVNPIPNPQDVTAIAGYSFTDATVAAPHNQPTSWFSGQPPIDYPSYEYVISVPSAGYYPMEWDWCSANGALLLGYCIFSTGSDYSSYVQNFIPGMTTVPGNIYLASNVQCWLLSGPTSGYGGSFVYSFPYSIPSLQFLTGIPLNCEWPIKKTPLFNTITRTPRSNRGELRIALMEFPLWNYELSISYLPGDGNTPTSPYAQLVSFLEYIAGSGDDFLLLDPFHNSVTNQEIAVGDGSTTEFSMYWTLIDDGAQELVQNFVSPPSIYVSNVLQNTSSYSINSFGTLSFDSAPANTDTISWSGQFFYRVKMLDDFWPELSEIYYQQNQLTLKLRSVLL